MPANDIFDGLRLALHGVAEAAKQATLRIAGAAIGGGGVLFLLLPKHLAFPIRDFSKHSWTFPANTP